MRYAIVETRGRSEAGRSGERAKCPGCGAAVVAKVGSVVVPHWAHMATADCDSSRDPETPWHRAIKDALAAPECQEVVFFNTDENGRRTVARRADVCCGYVVVEVQRSPISIEEVDARSLFYTSRSMIVVWIFHVSLMRGARGVKPLRRQIGALGRSFTVPGLVVGAVDDQMTAKFSSGVHIAEQDRDWTACVASEWTGDASTLLDRLRAVDKKEKDRRAKAKAQSDALIAKARDESRQRAIRRLSGY